MSRVVFDFDGTIAVGDSFRSFIVSELMRQPLRAFSGVALLPLGACVGAASFTRGASLFLWLATVGVSPELLQRRIDAFGVRRFVGSARVYQEAVSALRAHIERGDEVFVVSGCEESLLRGACQRLGLESHRSVGSRICVRLGGMVSARHCIGATKLELLGERAGWNDAFHLYTDSATDLPLARHATRVTLVNASPRTIARMKAGAPEATHEAVHWSHTVALSDAIATRDQVDTNAGASPPPDRLPGMPKSPRRG